MKLFLLCIGISLSLLSARAQDTIHNPIPDTLRPAAAAAPADSIVDTARINSTGLIDAKKDSLPPVIKKTDSTEPVRHADSTGLRRFNDTLHASVLSEEKSPIQPSATGADTGNAFKNSDTTKIVDIFEEMRKAREQQDKSIQEEQAKEPAQQTDEKPLTTDELKDSATLTPHQDRAADSSRLKAVTDTVQRDTIQSIFTLPAVAGSVVKQSDTVPSDHTDSSVIPAVGTLNADSSGGKAMAVAHRRDSLQPKERIKTHSDDLFDSTPEGLQEFSGDSLPASQREAKTDKIAVEANKDTLALPQTPVQKSKPQSDSKKVAQPRQSGTDTSIIPAPKPQNKPDATSADSSASQANQPADSLQQPPSTPFTELFQPYRTFDKETQISSTTSLTILQQHVDYKTSAEFTTEYQRTGQQDGQFRFDVSVMRLNTEVETMGVQLKYDSNKKTDSTSTFAKPLFDIVGKKTYLQVDSTGKITAIDNSALGRQVNTVLSGLSLSGGDFETGNNFGLLMSKPGPAEIGQQWSDSVKNGGNKRITTYTIQSILDGNMLVTISGTVSQTGVIHSDGATFKTHFTGTQKGKMYVDQQTLLVRSRDITLHMKGTVDYNGQSLPASAISKINEKVTAN